MCRIILQRNDVFECMRSNSLPHYIFHCFSPEQCAIKIIYKKKAPRQYLAKFLPREVKALRRVRGHPNVVG